MPETLKLDRALGTPYLEYFADPGEPLQRILIDRLPFRIGRSNTCDFPVHSSQVSKEHSEISRVGLEFHIRDLGSTNGTFLNGESIQDAPLQKGDIIHVANKEFRFEYEPGNLVESWINIFTQPAHVNYPNSLIRAGDNLREMLKEQWVRVVFQPIVSLETAAVMGYEALGRGTHSQLSPNPADLFGLADQCNLAGDLSRMFRLVAGEEAARLPSGARVFFNIHPSEIGTQNLLESLEELKTSCGKNHQVVLEVHEETIVNGESLSSLRSHLKDEGIELAYDDFGTGQSRLALLAEMPPHFLKLDRSLVRDVHQHKSRQEMIQSFNRIISDLGGQAIAEGIESQEEATICHQLGCQYGQGFLFGRPSSRLSFGSI